MRVFELQALMLMLEFGKSLPQLDHGHLSILLSDFIIGLNQLLLEIAQLVI